MYASTFNINDFCYTWRCQYFRVVHIWRRSHSAIRARKYAISENNNCNILLEPLDIIGYYMKN